jgi:hypothetical protein
MLQYSEDVSLLMQARTSEEEKYAKVNLGPWTA